MEFKPSTALHSSHLPTPPAHPPPPRGAPSHPQGARATAVASPAREVHEEQGGGGEQERVRATPRAVARRNKRHEGEKQKMDLAHYPKQPLYLQTRPTHAQQRPVLPLHRATQRRPKGADAQMRAAPKLCGGFFSHVSACTPSAPVASSVAAALAPSPTRGSSTTETSAGSPPARTRAPRLLHEDLAAPALNKWRYIQATLHFRGQQNAGNGQGAYATSTASGSAHEPFSDSPDAYATPCATTHTSTSISVDATLHFRGQQNAGNGQGAYATSTASGSAHEPFFDNPDAYATPCATNGSCAFCLTVGGGRELLLLLCAVDWSRKKVMMDMGNAMDADVYRSIRDPPHQMRALLRLGNPFLRDKRGRGFVYMHGRILCDALEDYWADSMTWDELLDLVEIKVGSTNDLARRGREYRACEEDYVLFSWSFFVAPRRMLLAPSPGYSEPLLVSYNPPRVLQLSDSWWIFWGQGDRQAVQEDDRSIQRMRNQQPRPMARRVCWLHEGVLAGRSVVFPPGSAVHPPVSPCTPGSVLSDSEFSTCTTGLGLVARCRRRRRAISPLPLPIPKLMPTPILIHDIRSRGRTGEEARPTPDPSASTAPATVDRRTTAASSTSTVPSPTLASHTKGVQFAHSPAFLPPPSPSHKASTLGLGARMKHFASLRSRSQCDDKPPSSFVGGQTLAPRFTVVCGGMRGFVVGSGTEWWGWESKLSVIMTLDAQEPAARLETLRGRGVHSERSLRVL
ncbi:hypothetical protein B0H19DRAFT_1062675 [Mycena capillaripes]|nr:hypothetical protein B0H19DRAFT_1062675 [Mycena capillaripes]